MTEQVIDTLIYNRQEFPILAISGRLPIPEDFGMKPVSFATSCYRGFYSRYVCEQKKLFLDEMTLRTREENYPAIGTIQPFRAFRDLWSTMSYIGLQMPIKFTGGLIIGTDFRRGTGGSLYLSWWRSYSKYLELIFDVGNLKEEIDWSEKMPPFSDLPNNPNDIEGVFKLKYDFNYPLTLRVKDES